MTLTQTNGADPLRALRGQRPCSCVESSLPAIPPRVVLTGGPGAGKTAVLEVARRHLCGHVVVLPEAASILFEGGFPRRKTESIQRVAQRTIFHVQDGLERLALAWGGISLVLCDRGVVDGAAYWPGDADGLFAEVGTTRAEALARYEAVLHLRTPDASGYVPNDVRVESVREAAAIDARIAEVWSAHPHRIEIPARHDFVRKLGTALTALEALVPPCCRGSLADAI